MRVNQQAVLDAIPYAGAILKAKREEAKLTPVRLPTFRGAALELQSATDMEIMLAGPSETGKTFATLWKLDSMLRSTPRARGGLVRKIRATMAGTVLQTWDRVIEIRGGVVKFGGERADFYEYPNKARVYVGGMDDPGKVLSSDRDWLYANQAEELALGDWETLSTRTTGRGAVTDHPMLFGDCNPGPPGHWILKRPFIRLLHSKHVDNPTLYDDLGNITPQGLRTMSVLDRLTGVRRSRLRDGLWIGAQGVVYPFERGVHVIARKDLGDRIRRWVCGVDFGYTNPFVWQRWGLDEDGRMYLDREIYRTKQLVQTLAVEIKRLNEGYEIDATVCDHDAEGRATLENAGISTVAAYKAVDVGIQNIEGRMTLAGDGLPRLFVLEDACEERDEDLADAHKPTCTLEEFESYRWPTAPDGKALKESPVKENDHGMDVTRYVGAYVDHLGEEGDGEFHGVTGDSAVYAYDEGNS